MKKKMVILISAMVLIALTGSLIINIMKFGSRNSSYTAEKKLNIVTTFYPIYLIGLNLADQIDELDVKSLTQLNTGCLHDYQLTTEDMKLISNADMLIINGGGMESFLEDVKANYLDLTIIDTSQGINLLNNEDEHNEVEHDTETEYSVNNVGHDHENEHNHDYEDENTHNHDHDYENEHAHDHANDFNEEHNHDHGEYNAHVWLDPELYIKQIETFRDGVINYISDNEIDKGIDTTAIIRQLKENADTYISSVESLNKEVELLQESLTTEADDADKLPKAVVFHDSFVYLANKVGIDIAYTIPLDSDTSLSAGDIAEIIDVVNQDNIKYLFTEQQYSNSIARQIAAETNAKVYIIDSVVTGNADKNSYLTAMRANLDVIRAANQ